MQYLDVEPEALSPKPETVSWEQGNYILITERIPFAELEGRPGDAELLVVAW